MLSTFSLPMGLTLALDCTIGQPDPLLLGAYVPGIAAITEPTLTVLTLKLYQAETFELVDNGAEVMLSGPFSSFPMDGYHLLGGMVRRALLQQRIFCVHSACVGDVLLVGHSSAGKTSVALQLIKHGWPLLSGNKTVVEFRHDQIISLAGTETITAKNTDLARQGITVKQGVSYGDRRAFVLPTEQPPVPVVVRSVVILRLNDGVEHCDRLSSASAMHSLYPYFMDQVNADVVVGRGQGVLHGDVPEGVSEYLAAQLNSALQNLPVYSMSGSLNYITERIKGL